MDYQNLPLDQAYALQNAGGLVLVCTRGKEGRYNLAPVAWSCPLDNAPVSKILAVCDTGHKTYEDLLASRQFALALPTPGQRELVTMTGSCSGRDQDKYEAFDIGYFRAAHVDARIPEGVAGWLECRLIKVLVEGSSGIVLGEVIHAMARPEAWKERLHYVSEGKLFSPGPALD